MQFQLKHHNQIIRIINSLNNQVFQENQAYFGGGTLIALLYDEYRRGFIIWSEKSENYSRFAHPTTKNFRGTGRITCFTFNSPTIARELKYNLVIY